jgi:hypothetical protein
MIIRIISQPVPPFSEVPVMHRAPFQLMSLLVFTFFAAVSAQAGELKIGDATPDF